MDNCPNSSIAVTTYGTQSFYTHACLESIREWKSKRHQLIVATHDESLLLDAYLSACVRDGLINHLIHAPHDNGHTRGVDDCFGVSQHDYFFNICNDILIGPAILDNCSMKLREDPGLGMIGWHWYTEGTFWNGSNLEWHPRDSKDPNKLMGEKDQSNCRNAKWYTGKAFNAMGGFKLCCLCNTAFFGIRSDLFRKVGPFSGPYRHFFADDFLNYAVLDQGYSISHFEKRFRNRNHFHEFQYDNVDVQHRHRNLDRIDIPVKLEGFLDALQGGLTREERSLIYWMARSIPDGATVLNLGVWMGASMILFLQGMNRGKVVGVDCFNNPSISSMSGQPPVSLDTAKSTVLPFTKNDQDVSFIEANTLENPRLVNADYIFVDAGHTKECIENDIKLSMKYLNPGGTLIFHDYGQPMWPHVKPLIDSAFGSKVKSFHTLAVVKP